MEAKGNKFLFRACSFEELTKWVGTFNEIIANNFVKIIRVEKADLKIIEYLKS